MVSEKQRLKVKQFKLDNPERAKKYAHDAYVKRKQALLDYYREKVHCDVCNRWMNRSTYPKHLKTDLHRFFEGEEIKKMVESGMITCFTCGETFPRGEINLHNKVMHQELMNGTAINGCP